jgi:hypothetical protein
MKWLLVFLLALLSVRFAFARPGGDTLLSELQAHEQELTYRNTDTAGNYAEHSFRFLQDRIIEQIVFHNAESGFNTVSEDVFCYYQYADNGEDCPFTLKTDFKRSDLEEVEHPGARLNYIRIPAEPAGTIMPDDEIRMQYAVSFLQFAYPAGDTAARSGLLHIIERLRKYVNPAEHHQSRNNKRPVNIHRAYRLLARTINENQCREGPARQHVLRTGLERYSVLNIEERDTDQGTRSFTVDLRKVIAMKRLPERSGCTAASTRYFLRLQDSIPVSEQGQGAATHPFRTDEISFVIDFQNEIAVLLLNHIINDNLERRYRVQRLKESKTY